ncbi:MAG: hypothetical protein WBH75_17535 [Thermoanaerobaculia bacterium]
MAHRWPHSAHLLFAFGLAAFLIAGLSIADMFLPRPYDGVVLEADTPGRLIVRKVVDGSGAARAGIRHGHQIVGIDRNVLRSSAHAAELLNRYRIGETVPYLVRGPLGLKEVEVDLGYRQIGSLPYLVACFLGFAFFFIGLFVLRQQPRIRPAQIFFVVCILFLLFLVCRLRPASYSWVDSFVLTTGMLALLFLPACFLHFFLVFPRPVPLRPEQDDPAYARKRRRWCWRKTGISKPPAAWWRRSARSIPSLPRPTTGSATVLPSLDHPAVSAVAVEPLRLTPYP